MSTQQAISFCLCCFSQVVRHLWSLHGSGICRHTTSIPVGTSIWPAGSFCLCCFWQAVKCFSSLQVSGFPHHTTPITWTSTLVGMSTWPAGSFCLCCFWQVVRHLWSLHMSRNHCHTDLHSRSNVYTTSWFIVSVLFLPGGGMSVVPTCVEHPPSHGPAPW